MILAMTALHEMTKGIIKRNSCESFHIEFVSAQLPFMKFH